MGALIIVLILILAIACIALYLYVKISRKLRSVSQMAFGTSDIVKGIKDMELQNATTPKSVAGMTSLYLPQIQKDFPEFNYEEMRSRSINLLKSFLHAVDENNISQLTEGTDELKNQVALRIQNQDAMGKNEHFKEIKDHRTELVRYQKTAGRCTVTFQTSIQYKHYIEKNGQIVKGKKDLLEQARYNVEAIYIQDRDVMGNEEADGLGLVCPNCGAPVKSLGSKVCAYCDAAIVEFNFHVWGFDRIEEVV